MKVSNTLKKSLILTIIALASLWSGADTLAEDTNQEPKRVLAIFVYKQGLPWAHRIEESLRTALATESS